MSAVAAAVTRLREGAPTLNWEKMVPSDVSSIWGDAMRSLAIPTVETYLAWHFQVGRKLNLGERFSGSTDLHAVCHLLREGRPNDAARLLHDAADRLAASYPVGTLSGATMAAFACAVGWHRDVGHVLAANGDQQALGSPAPSIIEVPPALYDWPFLDADGIKLAPVIQMVAKVCIMEEASYTELLGRPVRGLRTKLRWAGLDAMGQRPGIIALVWCRANMMSEIIDEMNVAVREQRRRGFDRGIDV